MAYQSINVALNDYLKRQKSRDDKCQVIYLNKISDFPDKRKLKYMMSLITI